MRKASTCWRTRGKDVVRRRCRGKGSLQRRGVSSCVQWKVNGTLPTALFPVSMHSSHWLADKVQRSTDCFFFPEPPGGVVPRGEGGALSAYRPGLPALGPQGPGPSGPVLPTVPTPPGSQAWHTKGYSDTEVLYKYRMAIGARRSGCWLNGSRAAAPDDPHTKTPHTQQTSQLN